MSGKKTKFKAGCGVVTIFSMGFVLGAITLLILIIVNAKKAEGWKTAASKEYVADHLANKLEMTDEQREQVRPLVNDFLDRRWELRRDYLKSSEKVMEEEYLPRIDKLLTDTQKEKIRKILEDWRHENQAKIEEPAER